MVRTLQLVTTRRPFFEQQVRALERNDISCTVVTVPAGDAGARSPTAYFRFYARALRRLATDDFDLVHANYGLTAPAAIAQPVRPIVLSLWGSDVLGRIHHVSRCSAALFDDVVVMSEEMAAALDRPCRVIPHGVDTDWFSPAPQRPARTEVDWDHDACHILFPYDPSRAVKDYPRAERIVDRVADAIEGSVELHAVFGVEHNRVPVYMNAADALLLTSKHEGSPNAVKEALACDLPIVATAVGDIPNLLDGVDGSRACRTDEELVDGLVDVLSGTESGTERENVERHSLERMEAELLALYDDVLPQAVVGA